MNVIDLAGQLLVAPRALSILIFHRVANAADPLIPDIPDAATFERLVMLLAEHFNVIPLSEAAGRLRQDSLPPRAACITFDDGYADNHDVAMPILARHGLTATFFIATGFLNGGIMWNDRVIESVRRTRLSSLELNGLGLGVHSLETLDDRRAALAKLLSSLKYVAGDQRNAMVTQLVDIAGTGSVLPRDLMMRSEQVAALLAGGMDVGAHTVSHPILALTDEAVARREIRDSRDCLGDILRQPIRLFAYPNGKPGKDYTVAHVAMVRDAGFDAAVSTSWGVSRSGSDIHQLPRFTPWDRPGQRFLLQLYRNCFRRTELV